MGHRFDRSAILSESLLKQGRNFRPVWLSNTFEDPGRPEEARAGLVRPIRTFVLRSIEILAITAALLSPLIARAAMIEADYVGITLKMNGTNLLAALEKEWPKANGAIYSVPEISLSEDLHSCVQNQRLSASDALQIEGELMSRQGTTYYLPQSQSELKLSVGFPKDTYLNKDDLREILPVHVQVSINVSPLTASYIVEKLGVRTTSEPSDGVSEARLPQVVNSAAQTEFPR